MKFLHRGSTLRFVTALLIFVSFVFEVDATTDDGFYGDDGIPCKTIKEVICATNSFTSFCQALDKTGLDGKLDRYESDFTVFVPSNSAFDFFLEELELDDIYDCPEDKLKDLLLTHIVEDHVIDKDDLKGHCGNLLEMDNGEKTRTVCENDGKKIYQKGAGNSAENIPRIMSFDIYACNGIIHVLYNVILPSNFGSPTRRPTSTPIRHPTHNPTRRPSRHPVPKPTQYPTRHPTRHPVPKPTQYPTRHPTRHPVPKPTRYPTRKPTRKPFYDPTRRPTSYPTRKPFKPTRSPTRKPIRPTRKPTSRPTRRGDNASCSAHPKCAALDLEGDCCPTRNDVTLDCCSDNNPTHRPTPKPTYKKPTTRPTSKPTYYHHDASCSAYPKCRELDLEGNCCPTNDGDKLGCCMDNKPPEGSCSAYPKCRELGLKGECCPTGDDVQLDCCYDKVPGTCSRYPGCVAAGLEGDCCPAADGKKLDCCDEEEHGFPIIDQEYCKYSPDFTCYKWGLPECCLKSSIACPKEEPRCEVGFPIIGNSYCTFAPNYGCYKNGWPECCGRNSNTCPEHRPDCEIGNPVTEYSYCGDPPNYQCYELGYPACCFDEDSDDCPHQTPSCNVGKRGCDLRDSLPSIYDFACSQSNFEILCYLIQKADIDRLLDDTGTYTMFAPSNDAFERLGDDVVIDLLENPTGELKDILNYHISDHIYFEEDLYCDRKIDTLRGDTSDDFTTTKCKSRGLYQKGNGNDDNAYPFILATDVVTCNGVVHVVDKVILPNE